MNSWLWSYHNGDFPQVTDGTDDYYVGIDATNGFSITPFAGLATGTFNILVNFTGTVDSSTADARIFEIANSARTSVFAIDIGNVTGLITGEYLTVFTNIGGTIKASGVADGGSISAGWHMITVVIGGGASNDTFVYVDGVSKTLTNSAGGDPDSISSDFTANKISLMATTAGGVPLGCTWREAILFNTTLSAGGVIALYNYYTRDVNVPLGNSDRSAWKFFGTPAGRAFIIALWTGKESGSDLLDNVTTASDLTKTNF